MGKAPFILFQKSGNLVLVGKAPFIFKLAHVRVYNKYSQNSNAHNDKVPKQMKQGTKGRKQKPCLLV